MRALKAILAASFAVLISTAAATAQRECSNNGLFPFPALNAVDSLGIVHEGACWNQATAKVTIPSLPASGLTQSSYIVATNNLAAPAGTNFWGINGTGAAANLQNATETTIQTITGRTGTFVALYVRLSAAEGAAATLTFTLRQNLGNTSITCQVPNLGTSCNITGQNVTFNPTDTFDVQVVQVGTGTSQQISFALVYQ